MQGVSGPGNVPNFFGAGLGGFQDGDPASGIQGTELTADLFNDMLGNLLGILSAAGVTPTAGRYADLSDALRSLMPSQFQLQYVSNAALALMPINAVNGGFVRIAGKSYPIAAGGLAIANANVMVSGVPASNLANSTTYLVFVADDGAGHAVPDFWPVATGHVPDTTAGNIGVEVRKNGAGLDNTRTLVGMVSTDGAAHFSDFLTLSWTNRRSKVNRTTYSAGRTTTSTTVIEINSEIRNSFLVWAGDVVDWRLNGEIATGPTWGSPSTGVIAGVAFDSTTLEASAAISVVPGSSMGAADMKTGLTEGLHYATVVGGATSGSTLTLAGPPYALVSGSCGLPVELSIIVRG